MNQKLYYAEAKETVTHRVHLYAKNITEARRRLSDWDYDYVIETIPNKPRIIHLVEIEGSTR